MLARKGLDQNPQVRFHFTPTYSSWLNQVEIAKIERNVIARGVFTSARDLSRKLMKHIRAYAKTARPFTCERNGPLVAFHETAAVVNQNLFLLPYFNPGFPTHSDEPLRAWLDAS